ncbi:DUF4365 domain-containing protein [Methylobacterium sp. W2]|uniref:DUF4365 domain-containing protein n=1 Tax=Methylobacterium sp. W2 TaxID=2598107 RepID=UPI001D0CD6E2|nr:DUF4365 domain-containing protein [Methylobacterium sp. W2]MCC0809464.1 DUF4365 domain-containing protein [Methylobacterium sp. W2]
MKLPKRVEEHVTETSSWRILQANAPNEWIVREVSERDYGVDCYVEIATKDGHITGELISVQLKGVKQIKWNEGSEGERYARSPAVKTATANYWLNLPVPVVLLVADLQAKKIYFAHVKETIRADYDRLSSKKTITFPLHEELHLASNIGLALFSWFNRRERQIANFTFHVSNLICHIHSFTNYIETNQHRDSFMEVEAERHLQFRSLHQVCTAASIYLNQEFKIDSLADLYKMDDAEWKDQYVWLHEKKLDHSLRQLERVFPKLVRQALTLVTERQASYWRARDPVFATLCQSDEILWPLRKMEERLSREGL